MVERPASQATPPRPQQTRPRIPKKSGPTIWPDGICSPANPWYKETDWDNKGRWIASRTEIKDGRERPVAYNPPWLAEHNLTLADLKEKPIQPLNTVADVTN